MRKSSYAVTFILVLVSLTLVSHIFIFIFPFLSILSINRLSGHPCYHPHRLVSKFFPYFLFRHSSQPPPPTTRFTDPGREFLYSRTDVRYGLMKRCERQVMRVPDPSSGSDDDWQQVFTEWKCRDFPKSVSDRCDKENRLICAEWTSAGYLEHLAVGFGFIALLALLIGVSTHSRRRRVWKAVAGLVTLNGAFVFWNPPPNIESAR
jgi:hypothetical protein